MDSVQQLLQIMKSLRDPATGCPWDREQDFQSLIPYTIEEAYEVADAIERNELNDIKEELGDLLFQIVFYSQLAEEQKAFTFNEVAQVICDKLVRRHPHVFANAKISDATAQTRVWEDLKQEERQQKTGKSSAALSHLDNVSRTLPSIMRAEKLQKRAARAGFDWPDIKGVMDKVYEELEEVQVELDIAEPEVARLEDEIGDLFFSCVNLSRHAGVDAEVCLRKANLKFEQRFRQLEAICQSRQQELDTLSSEELEKLWQEVKTQKK